MELAKFIQIGLPVSLALIMFSMGLTLRVDDFRQVLQRPRAFSVGLAAQLLLVPLIALLIAWLFSLPPLLAVGLLVLSFSPGGTTSNLFSYLARGDVALSVALTAVASFITPFTIPLLTEWALRAQLGEGREIVMPLGMTMGRLLLVGLLPVIIGMLWRGLRPMLADRVQLFVHRLSILLFSAVIVAIIAQQWERMPDFLARVGGASMVMILLAILVGWLVARVAGLGRRQTKTVAIEVGMQNGGMALIVTQGVLHNGEMSIVPVIYGLLMLIPVLLIVVVGRRENT